MYRISAILLVVLLALCGCSRQSTEPAPTANAVSDPAKQALLEYGATDDGVLPSPAMMPGDSLRAWMRDTSLDIYALTLVWGMVRPSTPPMPPIPETDWSGGMDVNGVGFMKLLCPIDFERGQDSILPASNKMEIVWASRTAWDIDGVGVLLAMKRGVAYLVPPMLGVNTKQLAFAVPVDRLEKFDTLIAVDNLNGLALHARKLIRPACPAGMVAGRWIREDTSYTFGHFDGQWRDISGKHIGYLMGKFWTVGDKHLFDGAYTDLEKNTLGHLKGAWRFDDPRDCITCGRGMGAFFGQIFDLTGATLGRIEGRFGPNDMMANQLVLPFVGKWQFRCPEETADNNLAQ